MEIKQQLINAALENGADLAGIAKMELLRCSASHAIYTKMGDYEGVGTVGDVGKSLENKLFEWPDVVKSVLVIGLSHPRDQPELDWWDGKGTSGNRRLIEIMKMTRREIEENLNLRTHKLHYYVEKGGVFLKDAATLAGFGCIGRNNLLLTPKYGPRIRLRALFIEADIDATGPVDFDPCSDCSVNCRAVCPEKAMDERAPVFDAIDPGVHLPARDGSYNRSLCNERMEKDIKKSRKKSFAEPAPIKYCRRCEFVCPVGK